MPSTLHPAAAAALASALVALGTWCNRRWIGWLPDDPPRPGRKQHARPMPLAGVVLVPATLPWLIAAHQWWLLAGFTLAAAVGFVDDWQKEHERDLGWRSKAIGLGVAAVLAAIEITAPFTEPWRFGCAVVFVFVLTNATNFLDNTDGVAVALAATSLLVLGLAGGNALAAAVGFAALGFLPWNWPRPHAFLGDAGAYALGLALGVFTVGAAQDDPTWLLAAALPLADFGQVVIARLWLGHPPWVGDRRHLTHIAQNLGLPRVAIAPVFAAVALLLALVAPS